MMDQAEFRRVMGHFATGVAVVTTTREDGTPCGLTANAVSSVSLRPSLVLVCVEKNCESHRCILERQAFAVNVLQEGEGETVARRFATYGISDKFQGLAYRAERTGSPVLEGALAWVDCEVREALPGGDHTVFLGEVMAGEAAEGTPLLYYRGGYGRFAP